MCHIVSALIRGCQVPVEPLTREDMKHLLGHFVEDRIVRGKQRKEANKWLRGVWVVGTSTHKRCC